MTVQTSLEDHLFDRLWSVWPEKKAKKKALEAFVKAARKSSWPGIDVVVEKARAMKRDAAIKVSRKEFAASFPHLATWLNQERWTDEYEGETTEPSAASRDWRQGRKV